MHTYIHAYIHTYIHTYIRTYVHKHIHDMTWHDDVVVIYSCIYNTHIHIRLDTEIGGLYKMFQALHENLAISG